MKIVKNNIFILAFIIAVPLNGAAAEAKKRAAAIAKEAVKVKEVIAPSVAKVPAEISQAEMEHQKKMIVEAWQAAVKSEQEIVEVIAISAVKAAEIELEKRKAQILENMVIKVQYYWIVEGFDITEAFRKALISISDKVIHKIEQKDDELWLRFAPGLTKQLGFKPQLIQEPKPARARAKTQI